MIYDINDWESKQEFYMKISGMQTSGKKFAVQIIEDEEEIRTAKQNNAIHKYFRMVGAEMSMAGVDKREFFKEPFFFSWSMEDIKEMFRMIAKALHYPTSTAKMTGKQIIECYEHLNRKTSEFGVSMEFPNKDQL